MRELGYFLSGVVVKRWIKRAGLLVVYAVALAGAGWFLANKLQSASVELQQERLAALESVQTQLSLSMVAAQSYVELLQTTVQNELAVRPKVAPPSLLLDALRADGDGVFSLDHLPSSIDKNEVGNLTGFGGLQGRDDYFRKELEVALSLRSAFTKIIQNIPNAAWVYYVSANRFEHVYPWVLSSEAAYKDNDVKMEYFQRGMPEKNPARAPYHTDIYDDDFGNRHRPSDFSTPAVQLARPRPGIQQKSRACCDAPLCCRPMSPEAHHDRAWPPRMNSRPRPRQWGSA